MISFSSFAVELIIWEIVLLVNSNNLRKVDYFILVDYFFHLQHFQKIIQIR